MNRNNDSTEFNSSKEIILNDNEDNDNDDDEEEYDYVDLADAIEVQVDDAQIPMDEDDYDDDDDVDDDSEKGYESMMVDPPSDSNSAVTAAVAFRHSTHFSSSLFSSTNVYPPDMSIHTFTSHQPSAAYAVACYTSSTTKSLVIVSGGGDDKAYLHFLPLPDADSSQETPSRTIPLLHKYTDSVSCVATNVPFLDATDSNNNNNNLYIAVGSYDGSILIYEPTTSMEPFVTLDGPTDVEFLSFHPKGGSVLLAGSIADGTLWMYHIPTKKCLQVFVGHECFSSSSSSSSSNNEQEGGVTAGTFTPDGKFALSIGMDGTMRLWAPRTGQCKHVFQLQQQHHQEEKSGSGLLCLAVDGGMDSQLAIAGSENGLAFVVHVPSKKLVATLRHVDTTTRSRDDASRNEEDEDTYHYSVEAVAFAPRTVNPLWVATGGSDGILKIWDLAHGDGSGQCRQTCRVPITPSDGDIDMSSNPFNENYGKDEGHNYFGITRISWHPHLPMVICSYTDGYVRLWDARNGKLLHSLCGGNRLQNMSEDDLQVNDMAIEFSTHDTSIWITTAHDNGCVKVFHVQTDDMMAN